MDISILLALQQLRESLPSFIETVLALFSKVADGPGLVALVLIVYWCIDKRSGQFAMIAFGIGNFICQFVKNIACVYRPWVRDAAIVPYEKAIEGAGGYSFPSGHTCGATTSLGSFAWLTRKKHKWITVVCIIAILLIAFSRLYFGVHTPQDVIVALLIGLIMIALAQAFMGWIERYDAMMPGHNKDVMVAIIVWIVCIASIAIVLLKPYPMDYVDGVLLVDPVEMQKGSLEAAGICAGLALAWVLERRFVNFSTADLDMRTRVIRFVIGVVVVGIAFVACNYGFKAVAPYNWAKLLTYFCVVIVGIYVAPLLFNKIEKRSR